MQPLLFFDIIKPRRIENLQREEPFCTDPYLSGNWLCNTHQYELRIVRFFSNPKNRTKRGPPVVCVHSQKQNTMAKMYVQCCSFYHIYPYRNSITSVTLVTVGEGRITITLHEQQSISFIRGNLMPHCVARTS